MLCYVDDESYLHLLLYLRWGMISVAVAGLKEACSHKRKKKKGISAFIAVTSTQFVWLKHAATNTSMLEHTWQALCTNLQSIATQSKFTYLI